MHTLFCVNASAQLVEGTRQEIVVKRLKLKCQHLQPLGHVGSRLVGKTQGSNAMRKMTFGNTRACPRSC